jgi:hypothetical protein
MNRRAVVLLPFFLVPALAACGNNAPSKQDYLADIDPVCKRGNEIATVFTTPTDLPMLKEFGQKMADNVGKTVKELEKHDRPGGDDGKAAEAMVKAMRDAGVAARAIGPEVDAANFTKVEDAANRAATAFKDADAKARALGSTECGKGEAEAAGRMAGSLGATVKKAYIAKVDPICKSGNEEIEKLPEPESLPELKTFLEKLIAVAEKGTADVKAIPPPVTDRAKLDEWLAANDGAITKAKEALAAATAGDERKTGSLADDLFEAGDTANAKADAYGFKECGTEGSS